MLQKWYNFLLSVDNFVSIGKTIKRVIIHFLLLLNNNQIEMSMKWTVEWVVKEQRSVLNI